MKNFLKVIIFPFFIFAVLFFGLMEWLYEKIE